MEKIIGHEAQIEQINNLIKKLKIYNTHSVSYFVNR